MKPVTVQEVILALRLGDYTTRTQTASSIEAHGIAPPDGMALVPIAKTVECPKCKVQRDFFRCAHAECPSVEAMLAAAPKESSNE